MQKHRGLSKKYPAMKATRSSRADERAVHGIAKAIYLAQKAETLDPLTAKTFAWINNRPTAYEREL